MEPDNLKTTIAHAAAPSMRAEYGAYLMRKRVAMAVLVVMAVALAFASIMAGSAQLSIADVARALVGQGDPYNVIVVWNLRMPRILTALIGGCALALAGCAFQSVLRNPLASASTLGIAQGAAFGASVAIIALGAGSASALYEGAASSGSPFATVLCAFAGAVSSSLVILGLSRFRDMTPETIVLAGVAMSALFTGGTALMQYFAEDTQVAAVVFWTFGDLGRVTYRELPIIAVVTAATAVYFMFNRWNYNAMESGEGSAHGLGVNVSRVRLANMMVGTLASATVIAFCGTINFIGLVAPHIMRRILGSDYRYLLPASAIAGAVVLLAADLVARTAVASVVLPISAITSFIGAPLFLYLLLRGGRR